MKCTEKEDNTSHALGFLSKSVQPCTIMVVWCVVLFFVLSCVLCVVVVAYEVLVVLVLVVEVVVVVCETT